MCEFVKLSMTLKAPCNKKTHKMARVQYLEERMHTQLT